MAFVRQENLALPLDVQGGEWDRFFVRFSGLLCLFFTLMIAVAAAAPLYEVAIAEGKVVPTGSVVRVEHFEGGIIKQINFRAGDRVKKGDEIITLKPTAAVSDQDQLAARQINLRISKIRLLALLEEKEPDFSQVKAENEKLVLDHAARYKEEKEAINHSIGGLTARVNQRAAEVKATELEVKSLRDQLAIHTELYQMRESLVRDGFTTRNSYLEAKARVAQTNASLAQLEGQLISGINGLTEAEQQLSEAISKARQQWTAELTEMSASISEINAQLGKAEDRVDRLSVRAPITGTIQLLESKSVGEVINPGDLVAEMVPENDSLIAEVRLKPEDVTNVKKGQDARVTLTAFDAREFGTIDGKVISVSPTTFTSDKGDQYYEARVSLSKQLLKRKGVVHSILPGMVVRAELIKDERSVLRYLLKPVFTAFDNSFGEH